MSNDAAPRAAGDWMPAAALQRQGWLPANLGSPLVILQLYGDLLNLYGENGNPRVLAAALRAAGRSVELQNQSLGDQLDFAGASLVYIGCGSEAKQLLALAHLRTYLPALRDYLQRGGLLLATGNAADLFGSQIIPSSGPALPALGLFDYQATQLAERQVSEVLFEFGSHYLIGFQNRSSAYNWPLVDWSGDCADPQALFQVRRGFGQQQREGWRIGGFLASSVLGLLTRNPLFLAWLAENLLVRSPQQQMQQTLSAILAEAPLENPVVAGNGSMLSGAWTAPGAAISTPAVIVPAAVPPDTLATPAPSSGAPTPSTGAAAAWSDPGNLAVPELLQRYQLQLDWQAYCDFLRNHHGINSPEIVRLNQQ
ncbi:MAG: hypothetical protein FWC59_01930 [Actinomycetia bacterium]|nr:hypothetical protein [Actinomycetes bacterium]